MNAQTSMNPRDLLAGYRPRAVTLSATAGMIAAAVACGFVASQSSLVSPALLAGLVCILVLACATLSAGVRIRGLLVGIVIGGHLLIGAFVARGVLPSSAALLLDALALAVLAISLWTSRQRWSLSLILLVAFIALVVLQCLNSDLPSISYGLRGARLLVLPAIVIIAIARLDLGRRDLIFIAGLAVAGWLVNLEFALRQLFVGFTPAELAFVESNESTFRVGSAIRLLGTMRSNQDFAFLAAVAVPLIAVLLLHMRSRLGRISVGVLFVASIAVLFGSLVRSGLVGGVIGAVVAVGLSVTTRISRRRLVLGGGIAVVLFSLLVAVGPAAILPAEQAQTIEDRVASVFSPGSDYSVNARVQETWPAAFKLGMRHPLGAGSGAAGPVSQSTENAPFGSVVPDNGYLLILVQLGITGLALFLVMLLAIGRELLLAARRGVVLAAAALGSLVALMLGMAASSFWDLTSPGVLFAVIIGLGLRAARVQDEQLSRAPIAVSQELQPHLVAHG